MPRSVDPIGPALACSTSCRPCCWTSSVRPTASTWSESAWTPSACERSKGGPDRRKPRRSGQARVQAAPGRRGWRAAAGSGGERGQRQRRHHVRGGAGRHPTDPHAHRPPAAPANQGPRRQAYDHRRCRAYLRRCGIRSRIARRMIESSQRLGRHRWTIERTGAGLGGWRRLRIRDERDSERFYALAIWPAR
jgi:hypothetical protein